MMKKQNKKRGFTIIELVIVVTVIAILSAVLIPTFAGVIKRSKQSADETAVRNLNTVIATADKDIDTVEDLVAFLESENIAMESYVPMSKGYSFVWADAENMVMLYSEKDKQIVFPAAYAGKSVAFATIITEDEEKPVEATDVNAFANNAIVAVKSELEVAAYVEVKNELVVDILGTISNPTYTETRGLFTAQDGATLTLNGNGTVDSKHTANDYSIAVWARGGDIVINGGNYTNVGAKAVEDDGTTPNNCELIYVTAGGKVVINGGTFQCENEDWTLNAKDDMPGSIIVKGGEFYEFDPSNTLKVRTTNATKNGIVIPEGYKVVKVEKEDGNWYKVVKE